MVAKTIQVKLIRSTNKCTDTQKATVRGLGLTKLGMTKSLENTPAVRGMVKKMIQWLEVKE